MKLPGEVERPWAIPSVSRPAVPHERVHAPRDIVGTASLRGSAMVDRKYNDQSQVKVCRTFGGVYHGMDDRE